MLLAIFKNIFQSDASFSSESLISPLPKAQIEAHPRQTQNSKNITDSLFPPRTSVLGDLLRQQERLDEASSQHYHQVLELKSQVQDAEPSSELKNSQEETTVEVQVPDLTFVTPPPYLAAASLTLPFEVSALNDDSPTLPGEAEPHTLVLHSASPSNHESSSYPLVGPIQVYLEQSEMYCRAQQWEDAIAVCQEILNIDPNTAIAYKQWGNILQNMGQTVEAMGYYAKALVIQPDYPEVYANLGSLYAKQEQWEEAISYYQKAITLNPKFAGAYRNLSKIWSKLEQPQKQNQCLIYALKLDPRLGSAEEHYRLGNELHEKGRIDEAIQFYRAAVDLNPKYLAACNKLADSLEKQGDWKSAVIYYRQVLDIRAENVKEKTSLDSSTVNPQVITSSLKENSEPINHVLASVHVKTASEKKKSSLLQISSSNSPLDSQVQSLLKAALKNPDSDVIRVQLGDIYVQQKHWLKAINSYKAALRINSKSTSVYLKLAKVFSHVGKLKESAESYHRAFQMDEGLASVKQRLQLGRTFLKLEDFEKAVFHYKYAAHLSPNEAVIHQELAEIFRKSGKYSEAMESWYQVVLLRGTWATPSRCVQLAEALLAQKYPSKAINCCRLALQLDPEFAPAQVKLQSALRLHARAQEKEKEAKLLDNHRVEAQISRNSHQSESIRMGMQCHKNGEEFAHRAQWTDAIQSYKQAIQFNPDFSWSYHNLGDALKKVKKWDDASNAYQKAILLNPDSPWTFYNLGDVLSEKEAWKEAAEAYSQAFQLDPNMTGLLKKLALALQNTSKAFHEEALELYSKAIRDGIDDEDIFQKVIENHLGDSSVYCKFGEYLYTNQRIDESIFLYHMASKIDPSNIDIRVTLCNILHETGQIDNAITCCQDALKDNPDSYMLLLKISYLFLEKNELEAAIPCLVRSCSLDSNSIDSQQLLADILYRQNKFEDAYFAYLELGDRISRTGNLDHALEVFQKCTDINPDHYCAYNCLGNIYLWKNELDSAILFYTKAVELKPDLTEAYHNLGNVCSAKGNIEEASRFYAMSLQK